MPINRQVSATANASMKRVLKQLAEAPPSKNVGVVVQPMPMNLARLKRRNATSVTERDTLKASVTRYKSSTVATSTKAKEPITSKMRKAWKRNRPY